MGKSDNSNVSKIESQIEKLTTKLNEWKESVSKEIADLTKLVTESLATQNQKISDLTTRVNSLEQDVISLKANNKQKDKTIAELSDRLEDTISHSRRLNIIMNGVAEKSDEDIAKVIKDIFVRKMQIPADVVDKFRFRDFHRIGAIGKQTDDGYIVRKDNKKPSNNQEPHRAIIIAFTQQMNRNLCQEFSRIRYLC